MSDFKPTPKTDLNTAQMLERYQLQDEATLQDWALLHGIQSNQGLYKPFQVDLIDHVHHHIHNLAMSMDDYKSMIQRRQERSNNLQLLAKEQSQPNQQEESKATSSNSNEVYTVPKPSQKVTEESNDVSDEVTDDAYEAIEMLTEQYTEAIEVMGERIADHFIDELDLSVMRHLAKKVKEGRNLNGKSQPNRFLKTIQAVLPGKGSSLLVPRKSADDPSIELEQNHRLG